MHGALMMRGSVLVSAVLAVGLQAGLAYGQAATEGPLAAPDPVRPAEPAKSHSTKPHPATHHKTARAGHRAPHATAHAEAGTPDMAAGPEPQAIAHKAAPADPLSFGMKWNGSTDDARETRIQNYDGSAQGTGAEVGLKLHF